MTRQIARNKLIVWLLVFVFAATSVFSSGSVFANTQETSVPQTEVTQLQEVDVISGDADEITGGDAYEQPECVATAASEFLGDDDIIEMIREAMTAREESVTFSFAAPYVLEYEELEAWFIYWIDMAVEETDNPAQGDYLYHHLNWWTTNEFGGYIDEDGYAYYEDVVLSFDYYTTAEQENAVNDAVDSVLAELISDGMSDYEKIFSIYSFVAENAEYDYAGLEDENDLTKYSAYGALIEESAVCAGFSNLLYRLLEEAGFDSRIITGYSCDTEGNEEPHAWNIVELEGKYYYLDATWDSETAYEDPYQYLLKGSDSFYNHYPDEYYASAEFTDMYDISAEDYYPEGESGDDVWYAGISELDYVEIFFTADGNKDSSVYFVYGDGNEIDLELPYYCDLSKPITMTGYLSTDDEWINLTGDPVTVTIKDNKGTAKMTAVSLNGESASEYAVNFTVAAAPSRLEYVDYSFVVNSSGDSVEAGDSVWINKNGEATIELPYNLDRSQPVVISGYYPDGKALKETVDMTGTDEKTITLSNGGKEYKLTLKVVPPSSNKNCYFRVEVDVSNYDEEIFENYSRVYLTEEDADENGVVYMEVPYGTFSNEHAFVSLHAYADDAYTVIEGEEFYQEYDIAPEAGQSEIRRSLTVTAEDGSECEYTLIIRESDGRDFIVDSIEINCTTVEGDVIPVAIYDPGNATIADDEGDKGYTLMLPGNVDETVPLEAYVYADTFVDAEIAGETVLEDGEVTFDISVRSQNPEYAIYATVYRIHCVKEEGKSAQLEYLGVQWHTEAWTPEGEDPDAEYQRGMIAADLEKAKTPEGATVKVPSAFFELAEQANIDALLMLRIIPEEYSYFSSNDLEIYEDGVVSDLYEYIRIGEGTYSFDVTSADKQTTQKYTIHIVKNDVKCPGHEWSDYEITDYPTCEYPGLKIRYCLLCGEAEWTPIPAAHEYGIINNDENNHWKECFYCSEIDETTIEKHNVPEERWEVVQEPQIGVPGIKAGPCDTCGFRVTEEIPALIPDPDPIESAAVEGTYTYTGKAIEPEVTVYGPENKKLTEGTDYTVSYENNINAGTATATVTGKGSYEGTLTAEFTINARSMESDLIKVKLEAESYTYDGTAKEPEVTVTINGKVLAENDDYTVEYKNNTEIGTATVIITGKGNLKDSKEIDFTIKEKAGLFDEENVVRLSGATRYGTSAAISSGFVGDKAADAIVIVDGRNFPDALAAGPFAHSIGAPVIMVDASGNLDPAVEAEIDRIDPDYNADIYIIGGEGSVTKGTVATLEGKGYKNITRISGKSRFDTAVEIAKKAKKNRKTVFIADGHNYPDALGGGSAAAVNEGVILFTNKTSLPEETKSYLENISFENAVILGGEGSVSKTVEKELIRIMDGDETRVTRLAGSGRVETSLAVADYFFPETDTIAIATAYHFADALAGCPLASALDAPIVLVNGAATALPDDVKEYIKSSGAENVVVLGGPGSVSESLKKELADLVK